MRIDIEVVFDNPYNVRRQSNYEMDLLNSKFIFNVLTYNRIGRIINNYFGPPSPDVKGKPEFAFQVLHIQTHGNKIRGQAALIVFDKREIEMPGECNPGRYHSLIVFDKRTGVEFRKAEQ